MKKFSIVLNISLAVILISIGMIYKLMHWPYGKIFHLTGTLLLVVFFFRVLIAFTFRKKSVEKTEKEESSILDDLIEK